MFVAGIGLSAYGAVSLISLLLQVQKAANNAHMRIKEDVLLVMITISMVALAAGIVLIIFGVIKSKNKNALDRLANYEKNSIEQARCKSCGLNLSENVKICPRCGSQLGRDLQKGE